MTFEPNPAYMPALKNALGRALDDTGDEIVKRAQTYIGPYSMSAAAAIKNEKGGRDARGVFVRVVMGRGLGSIFEFSKQQSRRTRSGANRGVMRRREFFHRAKQEVLRRGINLRRYI